MDETVVEGARMVELPAIDVAVIGAGMARLSTAVYARLSDLSVRVFEQHIVPGGLCTSWKRKGYVFHYCIDYLFASSPGVDYHAMWRELGVIFAAPSITIRLFRCATSR